MAAMGWNRKSYGVTAQRGLRVLYTSCGHQEFGPIRSAANGGHLNIPFDGIRHTVQFSRHGSNNTRQKSPSSPLVKTKVY